MAATPGAYRNTAASRVGRLDYLTSGILLIDQCSWVLVGLFKAPISGTIGSLKSWYHPLLPLPQPPWPYQTNDLGEFAAIVSTHATLVLPRSLCTQC